MSSFQYGSNGQKEKEKEEKKKGNNRSMDLRFVDAPISYCANYGITKKFLTCL